MLAPDSTELVVVRHGETVWNADGRLQGHMGGELSPLGHRQAQAVARRLRQDTLHVLYSSDLERALQTAEYVARASGLPVVTDARLRERCMGVFEGLTWEQARERYPTMYATYKAGEIDYAMQEGESSRQVYKRVLAGIAEIASRHVGQRVVIITHGGVLHRLFRHTAGLPMTTGRNWTLYNASINRFFVRRGQWTLGTWGQIEHLRGIGTKDDA